MDMKVIRWDFERGFIAAVVYVNEYGEMIVIADCITFRRW